MRFTRPLLGLIGFVALVAVSLTVAPEASGSTRFSPAPARIVAAEDHAAFVVVVETRTSARLRELVGSLSLATVWLAAGLVYGAFVLGFGSATTSDARRRWRALLVGAPPVRV